MLINKTSTRYRDAYLKKKNIRVIIKSLDPNKKEEEEKKAINYLPEKNFAYKYCIATLRFAFNTRPGL